MDKIKINIAFIEPTGNIDNFSSDNQANTSRLSKLTIPSSGEKLFYLSEDPNKVTSPLDGQHKWFDDTVGYNGYVSKIYSNALGAFEIGQEPIIVVSGAGIRYLVIYSDILDGPLIERIEVNGVVYKGINGRVIIAFEEARSEISLKILSLSAPYQPAKITGIELGLDLDFDEENILEYTFGEQSQNSVEGLEYSVISRFGSLELLNKDNLFNNLDELDLLQNTIPVKVFINNNLFGEYLLREGNLLVGSSSASFQLSDRLINLDQLNWRMDFYLDKDKTAKDFIEFIMDYIGEIFEFYDTRTEQIFLDTKLPIAIIDASNVKTVLVKICEITNSCIFINNNGKVCIKYLEMTEGEVK